MLFDTHCHLNFQAFKGAVGKTIDRAEKAGISRILVPGTDLETSQKAIAIAAAHDGIYATVGIHPHHIYEYHAIRNTGGLVDYYDVLNRDLATIEKLLTESRAVAVGEVGIDRYYYRDTKYSTYAVDENFVVLQKKALTSQIKLALKYNKSLILHNRQATEDILPLLSDIWDKKLAKRVVFHCCEADERLLDFAISHRIFIGVDGDVTWSKKKQRFIEQVPLAMLVLETDSPYLTPEPIRQTKRSPNEPANLIYIRDEVARIKKITPEEVEKQTFANSLQLFNLN